MVNEMISDIGNLMGALTDREQDIMRRLYIDKTPLSEVATAYSTSEKRIIQIAAKASKKLRHQPHEVLIKDY